MQNNYHYVQIAEKLDIGQSTRGYCPECMTEGKLWITRNIDSYFCYCNKCSYKHRTKKKITLQSFSDMHKKNTSYENNKAFLPSDFTLKIPQEAMWWLLKYSISEFKAREYKIGYSPSLNRIILPIYDQGKLVFTQARAILPTQMPKYLSSKSVNKSKLLFKSFTKTPKTVVITEDILSAIVVSKVLPSVSIMGTVLSDYQLNYLVALKVPIIVWLDGDSAGIKGRKKITQDLELAGVPCSYICTSKDPKEYNTKEMERIIKNEQNTCYTNSFLQ